MLDLVLKFIDRCIALVKRREQVNRSFYVDFVNPAFADFERVHKDYMDSFRNYREEIKTTSTYLDSDHPILDMIRRDSLFSVDLRAKLWELEDSHSDKTLGELVHAIISYLTCVAETDLLKGYPSKPDATDGSRTSDFRSNIHRFELTNGLSEIFQLFSSQEEKRQACLAVLDEHVTRIQRFYKKVVREEMKLKRALLKAK